MTSATHILLVDDEPRIIDMLRRVFELEGFRVSAATDAEEAIDRCRVDEPDVILLDLELPGMDGQRACGILRTMTGAPIVMLTARSEEDDKVVSLMLGADDYVTKPFSARELTARVHSLLRRSRRQGPASSPPSEPVSIAGMVIDGARRTVEVDGVEVPLTKTEFSLLHRLATNPGVVCTRRDLLSSVWQTKWFGEDHLLEAHIHNLRKKLVERGVPKGVITTVRGVGYRMDQVAPSPR